MPVYTYHPLNSFFLSLAFTAWGADTDESVTCHAEINPDSMQIINSLNVFCRPHSEAEARKNWIFTNLSTFLILVKHLNAVKAYYIFGAQSCILPGWEMVFLVAGEWLAVF